MSALNRLVNIEAFFHGKGQRSSPTADLLSRPPGPLDLNPDSDSRPIEDGTSGRTDAHTRSEG